MTISVAEWRYQSILQSKQKSETLDIEINAILSFVLQKDLAWCLAHSETLLSTDQQKELDQKFRQLLEGIPLPYILGEANFFNSSFLVNQNVLIPRPETELLAENAIQWIENHKDVQKIVDVGTGSGAIILSILNIFPAIQGYAVDISRSALNVALKNKKKFSLQSPEFVQMDCLSAFNTKFDVILANLPYIPTPDVNDLEVAKYEPVLALNGGPDGMEIIRKLVNQLPNSVNSPGLILFEVQFDQALKVSSMVQETLPKTDISIIKDYAGIDRFVRIEV